MREKILDILKQLKPDVDFKNCGPLLDGGILDSFDIVFLIGRINEDFGLDINVGHLLPENFNSVDSIIALIKRMQEEE